MRSLKLGIDCAQLFVRGKLFVCLSVNNRVRVRHRSAAVDRRHKNASNERAQRTEIPFAAAQRTAPILFDTRQVREFARQSNEHCLALQPRAIDTRL
jgi:hypothetical protein